MIDIVLAVVIGFLISLLLSVVYHKKQIDAKHSDLSESIDTMTTAIDGKIERNNFRREFDRPYDLEKQVDKYAKQQIIQKHVGVSAEDIQLREVTFTTDRFIISYSVDLPSSSL